MCLSNEILSPFGAIKFCDTLLDSNALLDNLFAVDSEELFTLLMTDDFSTLPTVNLLESVLDLYFENKLLAY